MAKLKASSNGSTTGTDGLTWTNIRVKLGDLTPWSDNPRMSSKKQAKALLDSWREFGQVQTVAVSPTLDVLDGHQRLSALLTVHGKEYEIDARQASRALTDEERRRLVLTLHAGAQGSWNWDALVGWDESLLVGAFDEDLLKQLNTQLNTDAAAVRELLNSVRPGDEAEPEDDKAEELQRKWQTARGQVWQVGVHRHRVMCGDSTDKADVARLIGGRVDSIVTDPPYEMDAETIHAAINLFGDRATLLVRDKQGHALIHDPWEHRLTLFWKRRQPRSFPTKNQPVLYHTMIVMIAKAGAKLGWQRPTNDFGSVIEIEGKEYEQSEFGHTKNPALFVEMMRGFRWEVWGDPFLGAGTTLMYGYA